MHRYAWSENAGWIDFGTSTGDVHVIDSALTGYAWSELAGWISLNCVNTGSCATVDYKVTNDGNGSLAGTAWGENVGWIQFAPLHGGVTIDGSGSFSGEAWGENVGWIVFNCSTMSSCGTVSYRVQTDWRPQNTRTSATILDASPNPSNFGDPVILTASVTPSDATGSLTFKDGSTIIDSATLGHGSGSITVSSFAVGSHALTAVYSGNTAYLTSTSDIVFQVVSSLPVSSSSSPAETPSNGGSVGGTRGTVTTQQRVADAQRMILARFNQQMLDIARRQASSSSQQVIVEKSRSSSESSSKGQTIVQKHLSGASLITQKRGHLAVVGSTTVVYRDVPTSAWFAPYVSMLVEDGIAEGYHDDQGKPTGEFGVENSVTRAELLKMALEAAGKAEDLPMLAPDNRTARATWAASYAAPGRGSALVALPLKSGRERPGDPRGSRPDDPGGHGLPDREDPVDLRGRPQGRSLQSRHRARGL